MNLVQRLRAIFATKETPSSPQTPPDSSEAAERSTIIYGYPTAETFDEKAYLEFNPDIAQAVKAGAFASGRAHFEQFEHLRAHRVPIKGAPEKVAAIRRRKGQRIAAIIKPELAKAPDLDGVFDFLTPELKTSAGVRDTQNVSSNSYDIVTTHMIDSRPNALMLDCGAGSRSIYYENVVNYEIVKYLSTDVLGVAESLPFKDDSFDVIFSYAVLEHVRQPFVAAQELIRVLKPAGILRAMVPFLQPLHGYPSHYFNMTHFGLRSLFEADLEIVRQFTSKHFGPMWTIFPLLEAWHRGLPEATRARFLDLTVRDLMMHPRYMMEEDFVTQLSEQDTFAIASATGLLARKPAHDQKQTAPFASRGRGDSEATALEPPG